MPVQFDQSELLQEAKAIVWRAEQASLAKTGSINPNLVTGTVTGKIKHGDGRDRHAAPTEPDELRRLRVQELALAFVGVSNGNAEVDRGASAQALERFNFAVAGRKADGEGFLLSQLMAIKLKQVGMMTSEVREYQQANPRPADTVTVKLVADVRPA